MAMINIEVKADFSNLLKLSRMIESDLFIVFENDFSDLDSALNVLSIPKQSDEQW